MAHGTAGVLTEQLLSFWGTRRLDMGEPQLLERAPGESWRREPQILSVHIAIGFEYTEQAESPSAEGQSSQSLI